MKKLIPATAIIIAAIIIFLVLNHSSGPDENSFQSAGSSQADVSLSKSDRSGTKSDRSEKSFEEQMAFILEDAHVTSDKYLLLLELLKKDESAVLAYLATLRYEEQLPDGSPEADQVEMIARAMLEFIRDRPLAENLEKLETLRETGALFTETVGDALFAGHGAESSTAAYQWILDNPEHPAALRSGAVVGNLLQQHTPKVAWEKATALPTGPIRTRAFTAIVDSTAHRDIDEAISYVNRIEAESTDLDQSINAILEIAMSQGHSHHDLVELASAPVDPQFRGASLDMLFQNWAQNDLPSFKKWTPDANTYTPDQLAEINLIRKQTLQRHGVDF